jgi:hypothetical protein
MMKELMYFAQHGLMTDPGRHADLLEGLPANIADLCQIVQGATIHVFWAERYGFVLPEERQAEVQLRTLECRLRRLLELDPRPLGEARPIEKKLVGNCRDFSLLLASALQSQGVPARPRCGFGTYFLPDHYEDHWVCEYWNAGQQRWILVDAQLDELQCEALKIPFSPLDVPRDQFIVGGNAWQMCRSGQADPDLFGIADMHGLWFVRGNFIRDVAALNKMELLPWDCWGLIEDRDESLSEEDLNMLDQLAGLTGGDVPDFETVHRLYESNPRLRVPGEVHSYTPAGLQTVRIGAGSE